MYKSEDITLYVPCYNVENTIAQCLDGILKQTIQPFRIFLVDDGSEPPLEIDDNFVEILRMKRNSGLSAVRNYALSNCTTPLIASLDADVVPEVDWLENLLEAMNNLDIAGAAGRMEEKYRDELADKWRAVHMAQHWGDEELINPRFLYGANSIFKIEVLDSIEGYLKELRTNYEDMSLCEKLYEKGYSLFYTPKAQCKHLRRDSLSTVLKGFWQWYHAKGLINNDFKTPEGLIDRIKRVNFGIYEYRYQMDADAGREDFLVLDSLIPWIFCAMDLQLARKTYGFPVPTFPDSELCRKLSDDQRSLLSQMIELDVEPGDDKIKWHKEYIDEFSLNHFRIYSAL